MSILLENVSKRFGSKPAVQDLSLRVEKGEVFTFLGPNGAGKTTTIKMICGLLRADAGRIEVCGCDMVQDGLAARSQMAYLPDTPFVYEKLTGREFCQFVARLYRIPEETARQRLEYWVERLEMQEFLDDLAETYSHGMRQKLALTAALLHDPAVLVMDEPMVGLDPRSVRVIKDTVRDLAKRGVTIFVSTHMLDVAEALAQRVGIIVKGHMLACAPLSELMAGRGDEHLRLEDVFLQLTC